MKHLRKKTNPELTRYLIGNTNLPEGNDYHGWSVLIGKISRNLLDNKHASSLHKSGPQHSTTPHDPQVANDPMDVDSLSRLSQDERDRRIHNNLCLACGQPGHRAADHHNPNAIPMPPRPAGRGAPRGSHGRGRGLYQTHPRGDSLNQQRAYRPAPHPSYPPQYYSPQPNRYYGPQFTTPQLCALTPGYVIGEETASTTPTGSPDDNTLSDQSQQSKDSPLA